jgi:copper chaperone CopZ
MAIFRQLRNCRPVGGAHDFRVDDNPECSGVPFCGNAKSAQTVPGKEKYWTTSEPGVVGMYDVPSQKIKMDFGEERMTTQTQAPPAHVGMLQLLNGAHVAGAVSCLAQLGIPDLVEAGPRSAEELASQTGTNPQALYRLMRATSCVGVLAERPDGTFSETPMSAVLRSNAKPSFRALAIMGGREWHGRGWSRLEYCVRTGKQALDQVYGAHIFEYLKQNPEEAQIFNDTMTALSTIDGPAVAEAYSFDGIHSIVDVGGGHGLLLATILAKNPHLRGTLYEVPHVIEGCRNGPLTHVMGRCTFATGDMFSSVPAGADAYIMKHIIHDWPDDLCVKILTACRKGVNPAGKLLVVDNVIQPGNAFAPGKFLDLQMLIFPGGCERTEKQFRDLFANSGWRLNRIIPTAAADSIVEGLPA